jgi:hypothetical protein
MLVEFEGIRRIMAREVDIWWADGGRLKASMRWTNKRGRISFFLIPAIMSGCTRCPFKHNRICSKWRGDDENQKYNPGHLCSMLWTMKGDNQFENRDKIDGWQILGPVKRERKRK